MVLSQLNCQNLVMMICMFLMYTFLKDKFTMLLGEYIDRIGGIITPYDKKQFVKHSMGALKFESYLLRDQKRLQHMVIILVLLIMFEIG